MDRNKIIYLGATGLLSALMLLSAGMYFFQYEVAAETFVNLGYPTYIIYPLAVAKLLGLVAIWSRMSDSLREWAYAGFFFDFVLALTGHLVVQDGDFGGAVIALVLLFLSYIFGKRHFGAQAA